MYYIASWFCEKIEYVLGHDAFPLPVDGETALELVENANKSDAVHEGTHAMDYINGISEKVIGLRTGEYSTYSAERLFQI